MFFRTNIRYYDIVSARFDTLDLLFRNPCSGIINVTRVRFVNNFNTSQTPVEFLELLFVSPAHNN